MKEYVVTFRTGIQISPDDWDTITPSLKVTENTTVKEIEQFYRGNHGGGFMEVKLCEMQIAKSATAVAPLPEPPNQENTEG